MVTKKRKYEQVLKMETQPYFNFINSLDSDDTKKVYRYRISKFLTYNKLDLVTFLRLPQEDIAHLLTKYLVSQKKIKTL